MIRYMTKIEAERLMEESEGDLNYLINKNRDNRYVKIREELVVEYRRILVKEFKYKGQVNEDKIKNKYLFDLLFGLKLYEYLSINNEESLSLRDASNIEYWIYLSVIIIPDIVSERWGFESYDRFFKSNNRVWLFTLWWYIHLSWQGDIDSTYKVLKNNSTDTILNLVDRTGRTGYDVPLYRTIMKEYSKVSVQNNKSEIFRALMVMNTSLLQTTEPSLYNNGYEDYVVNLFRLIGLDRKDNQYVEKEGTNS